MIRTIPSSYHRQVVCAPRRQRGVVLFIALLVMVALSLAGIALIRSADTATIVAGNLAFKQAAAMAVDRSVEESVQKLFDPRVAPATSAPAIADKTIDHPDQNYYACVQSDGGGCLPTGSPIPEVPAILVTKTGITPVPVDPAGNTSYHVIERMCANSGAAVASNCNLSNAHSDAGCQHCSILIFPGGGAYYRVSIRVDGPRNTVAYAQAILKE